VPAPEGWWVGGGETSSRIGGVGVESRTSSSGMLKMLFGVELWCSSLHNVSIERLILYMNG
jgi:hypothetical protein